MELDDTAFARTRRSLHGVAELLLAGPQHVESGKITLRPVRGGFGTTHTPDIRVEGRSVVAGERRAQIDGRTARKLAEEVGIEAHVLDHVYSDGSGVGLDDELVVDAGAAARIAASYATGEEALRVFAPAETPILWPEHFDLGISLDEDRVNLGISPGDGTIAVPYMYAGPWNPPAVDDFWNQPFGAARELPETVAAVVTFFAEAMDRISR